MPYGIHQNTCEAPQRRVSLRYGNLDRKTRDFTGFPVSGIPHGLTGCRRMK